MDGFEGLFYLFFIFIGLPILFVVYKLFGGLGVLIALVAPFIYLFVDTLYRFAKDID